MSNLPVELLERCRAITAKRPKIVVEHILQYGFITTEELKNQYGYNHPPRAVRDVREQGIPLETFRVTGSDGRNIAAYRFGELTSTNLRKFAGRTGLSKRLKQMLIDKHGCKCFVYLETMDERDLQIDHRVPYEIAGEELEPNPEHFMLLSASANRAKSWSCEHCGNWHHSKDKQICESCYWAYPENYSHIATRQIRRLDLVWQGDEVNTYEQLKVAAQAVDQSMPEWVKQCLSKLLLEVK